MRSESEVRWVRAKNTVGQMVKVSQWHAVVPGVGDLNLPPGTACSTALSGTLQFIQHSGIRNIDGRVHEECMVAALDYIAAIQGPGPAAPDEPDRQLAAPKTTFTESPRADHT